METPLVSVIIPVYNVEDYLRECVDSVLAQTVRDIEVILVDDGSPDGSGAICDEYAGRDARVRVLHKENTGAGLSRNAGIEMARGRYLCFQDSDDTLSPDALEILLNIIEKENAEAVTCRADIFSTIEGPYTRTVSEGEYTAFRGDELRHFALVLFVSFLRGDERYVADGSPCGALFRRSHIMENNIRFPNERELFGEDVIFNYNVARTGRCFCATPLTPYHHRVNPTSITRTLKLDTLRRICDYCEWLEEFLTPDHGRETAAQYAMAYGVDGIRSQCHSVFTSTLPTREKLAWARQMRRLPYICRINDEFDPRRMNRAHRTHYALFMGGKMRRLYYMTRLQQRLRRMRGHVS